jgi:Rhs element Vgr protein
MSDNGPESGDLVTFTVKVDGAAIPQEYQVHSVHVEQALNRISHAQIMVIDGSATKESFTVSAGSTFVPGKKVVIEAGYDSKNKSIFEGIICGQNLRIDSEIGSMLTVQCKDTAVKMTVGRQNAMYNKVKDSDVMSKLIGNHAGVSADVTATTTKWPSMIQNYCSDWDFLLSRAQVNAMVVSTLNGKVSVFEPSKNSKSVLTITYGDSLFSFDGDLDAVTQLVSVKASAWDPKTQKVVDGKASNTLAGPGNLSSKKLSDVVGLSEFKLQTTAPEAQGDLTGWAKAQMLRSTYSKIIAQVRFGGSEKVKPGTFITLAGLGERFDGDHLVCSVVHDISDGNWFTDAKLGLSADWFIGEPDVVAPAASGLLPGIEGLYNATVKKIFDDPDNAYRIQLNLPLLNPAGEGIWARMSNFYSTNNAGAFFLPEVGDEVIVGFLNQDPRYPVILGSVYSAKNKPFSELSPNQKNSHKAIVSKKHLRMVFNDEDVILTLTTPNKNIVTLDDKSKEISIKDQNGNSIVMSSSGIDMKSSKNINISADQKVTIKGKMGVSIEASRGDVASKGLNIKENASINYEAKGGAAATVQGGSTLTLKGAMVMIN